MSIVSSLFAAAALTAAPAGAQESEIFDFLRQETVYSAAKHSQKLSEAPAAAYVITADEIERYGYRTIAETLQGIPGFYLTNDRNYTYMWVRGFGRPSDYNGRILLMVNGHRLNENIYGSSFFGREESVDIRSVERLEVVKGPGSALYGDNAFFATVNIVTKKPAGQSSAGAAAETASYGARKGFADLSLTNGRESHLYAAFARRLMRGQDLYYGEFSDINGGRADGMDRERNSSAYLRLETSGWTLHGGASNRYKRIPTASFGTLFDNRADYTEDWRTFLEAERSFRPGDEVAMTARLYTDWYSYQGDYLYDYDPPAPTTVNKDMANSVSYGGEARTMLSFWGEGNELLLGQEYENMPIRSQQNFDSNPFVSYIDKNSPSYRWAAYAQQEAAPVKDLKLTMGLRYDWYKSFGHSLNPRAAAVYRLGDKDSLKLLYGAAFRAPNAFERDYAAPGTDLNPDLKPETVRTYEAVYERTFAAGGFVSLSYFQNRIRNLISQITNAGGNLQFVNAEKVKTQGMELGSKFRLAEGLAGHLGYTLQDTREVGHEHMTNSPVHTASAGLSKWFPSARTSLSVEAFFIGARRTVKDTTLSGAAQLSLTARTRPWKAGPTVFAGAYNLANAPYYVSGSGEHTQAAIRQDGRNYAAGLEYRF